MLQAIKRSFPITKPFITIAFLLENVDIFFRNALLKSEVTAATKPCEQNAPRIYNVWFWLMQVRLFWKEPQLKYAATFQNIDWICLHENENKQGMNSIYFGWIIYFVRYSKIVITFSLTHNMYCIVVSDILIRNEKYSIGKNMKNIMPLWRTSMLLIHYSQIHNLIRNNEFEYNIIKKVYM